MIFLWLLSGWAALNVVVALGLLMWHRAWCRTVAWTDDGIMPSAAPLESGKGDTAVLFVHGFNDVPYVWRRFVDELSSRGFHCRAMLLPGAGAADCHPTLAALRNAVDEELMSMRKTHRRVVLVGHSLGGALSLDAALRAKGRANGVLPDKIVLLAPLIEVSRMRSPVLSPYAWFLTLRILLPMLRWVPSVFREYLHAEDDERFVYRRDRFNEIGWYVALFSLVAGLRRVDSRALGIPTVVYVAGCDRVVDSESTRLWFGAVSGVRMVEWPDASHVMPLNHKWGEIVSEICEG